MDYTNLLSESLNRVRDDLAKPPCAKHFKNVKKTLNKLGGVGFGNIGTPTFKDGQPVSGEIANYDPLRSLWGAKPIQLNSAINWVVYPPGFNTPAQDCDADQNSIAYQCQGALRWVVDPSGVQTVCTALPCTLPAGLYAAAIGTNCTSNCPAALFGDEDQGLIYPFTASASFPSGGLPANVSGFTWSSGPVWNTNPGQGALTPIKPPKLLIY